MGCEDKRSMHRVHWVETTLKGQKDKLNMGSVIDGQSNTGMMFAKHNNMVLEIKSH